MKMYSTLESGRSPHGSHGNSLSETIRFQSSLPHLKRLIMFDQSGGKGRIFFHPALAQELFGVEPPGKKPETSSKVSESENESKLSGTKELVIKDIRDTSRPVPDVESSREKIRAYRETVAAAYGSLESARSSRREVLVSESDHGHQGANGKEEDEEDWEDLDALMMSEGEEEEEVRSTGHSPDESLEEAEEQQASRKKRRKCEAARKQTIKTRVRALRRMIPGEEADPARVLEQTIVYLKTLRARVAHLQESSRVYLK